jgi:hypothetical protein
MSRSYTSSPPSAYMACSGTALLYFTLCICISEGFFKFFNPSIFSCQTHVPLNSDWRTIGGRRTTV